MAPLIARHIPSAALLRDIIGNPFRPGYRWTDQEHAWTANLTGLGRTGPMYTYLPRAWLLWQGGTVSALARTIYDDRTFDQLPILADALEEAGCASEDILRHCRGWQRCPKCLGQGRIKYELRLSIPDLTIATPQFMEMPCDQCGVVRLGGPYDGRSPGWVQSDVPHARGCWVLDLLSGKE
jgi:hypothetical protein